MLAWLMDRFLNVLWFILIATAAFGGYKIVRTIISEGSDHIVTHIQEYLERKEINRIFNKRIGR